MPPKVDREATKLQLVSADAPSRPSPRRRDAQVERALQLLHERLDMPWTVTELARSVGLSRAAFARRFREHTGLPPHSYLTRCRMERAAELVFDDSLSLAGVAARVGYESEFAFNRAFRRFHGVPPGAFRRGAAPFRTSMRAAA